MAIIPAPKNHDYKRSRNIETESYVSNGRGGRYIKGAIVAIGLCFAICKYSNRIHKQQSNSIESEINSNMSNNSKLQEEKFDSQKFTIKINQVKENVRERLRHQYPGARIDVVSNTATRTLEQQQGLVTQGKSKGLISLHNVGAAADIMIVINGNISQDTRAYQVLGYYAIQQGLFRGWDADMVHVGETEYVYELLSKYPSLVDSKIIKDFYEYCCSLTEVSERYRPTIEIYEKIVGLRRYHGTYTKNPPERERKVIPIFNPSTNQEEPNPFAGH